MYSYVTFSVLLSAIVGTSVAVWLLVRNESGRPAFAFGLFMLTMAVWSATHVGTLMSETVHWQLRFTQLSYVSVVSAPITWLVFALRYTDRSEWGSGRRIALLSVVPVLTLGFVFTARHHSLFYSSISLTEVGGQPFLETEPGPWHVVNVAYSYTLLLIGTGLLVDAALTNNRLYRRQSAVLLTCAFTPWFVNGAYHIGIRPVPEIDPTPLAFTLVGIPLAALVLRTDLTTFVPIAHERVFQTLNDPVLVISPDDRILEANASAQSVLGADRPLEGVAAEAVLPAELSDGEPFHLPLEATVSCSIPVDGETRRFLAQCRAIAPERAADSQGAIVSLTDITVHLNQRDALAAKNDALETQTAKLELKNEQLERLASVVSHDLATPLATGESLLQLVRADLEGTDPELEQLLDELETVHDRLREFSAALPELARESTDVESPIECDLETVAEAAWNVVDTYDLTLVVESTRTVRADPRRLQQAFENLFQNCVEHGSASSRSQVDDGIERGSTSSQRGDATGNGVTTVRVGTLEADDAPRATERPDTTSPLPDRVGFYVEDDGPGIPFERREYVLRFGVSTGSGSGYGLAIVRTIVEAHGWSLAVVDSSQGGARFEVLDVE